MSINSLQRHAKDSEASTRCEAFASSLWSVAAACWAGLPRCVATSTVRRCINLLYDPHGHTRRCKTNNLESSDADFGTVVLCSWIAHHQSKRLRRLQSIHPPPTRKCSSIRASPSPKHRCLVLSLPLQKGDWHAGRALMNVFPILFLHRAVSLRSGGAKIALLKTCITN